MFLYGFSNNPNEFFNLKTLRTASSISSSETSFSSTSCFKLPAYTLDIISISTPAVIALYAASFLSSETPCLIVSSIAE